MLQFLKYVLATMVGLVLAGVVMLFICIGIISSAVKSVKQKDEKAIEPNSVLMLNFDTDIPDHVEFNPFKNISLLNGINTNVPIGLDEYLHLIKAAEKDDHIKGIYITSGNFEAGLATEKEIRDALKHFKTSKKFIYAYAPAYSQKGYYMATVADKIFINPQGGMDWKGLAVNLVFFKNLMDKIGIAPEIFYCGKYKSATEPFRLNKMSDANREMSLGLLGDIKATLFKEIAEARHIKESTLDSVANQLAIHSASDAKRYGFCDALAYEDEVKAALKEALGLGSKRDVPTVNARRFLSSVPDAPYKTDRIAIVFAEGDITDGDNDEGISAQRFMKALTDIRKDDKIKAVVLRVNSPGGSALASDEILREVELIKKTGRPVIVSMGNYAASGGYYISSMADSIVAQPYTLTGSIGVFGMAFNTEVLFSKNLGITFDRVTTNTHSDFFNPNRPMTDAEKIYFQSGVDSVYKTFKSHVSAGRHKGMDDIEAIAQGHVWTGVQGLNNGLVDRIGNLQDAIDIAARMAKIKEYSLTSYPKAKKDYKEILKIFTDNSDDDTRIKTMLGPLYTTYTTLKKLQSRTGIQMRMAQEIEIQ